MTLVEALDKIITVKGKTNAILINENDYISVVWDKNILGVEYDSLIYGKDVVVMKQQLYSNKWSLNDKNVSLIYEKKWEDNNLNVVIIDEITVIDGVIYINFHDEKTPTIHEQLDSSSFLARFSVWVDPNSTPIEPDDKIVPNSKWENDFGIVVIIKDWYIADDVIYINYYNEQTPDIIETTTEKLFLIQYVPFVQAVTIPDSLAPGTEYRMIIDPTIIVVIRSSIVQNKTNIIVNFTKLSSPNTVETLDSVTFLEQYSIIVTATIPSELENVVGTQWQKNNDTIVVEIKDVSVQRENVIVKYFNITTPDVIETSVSEVFLADYSKVPELQIPDELVGAENTYWYKNISDSEKVVLVKTVKQEGKTDIFVTFADILTPNNNQKETSIEFLNNYNRMTQTPPTVPNTLLNAIGTSWTNKNDPDDIVVIKNIKINGQDITVEYVPSNDENATSTTKISTLFINEYDRN